MLVAVVLVMWVHVAAGGKGPPDGRVEGLQLSRVTREVDLTSPLVKQKVIMVVDNKGSKPVTHVIYSVESQLGDKVAYIGAQVRITTCELFISIFLSVGAAEQG